MSALPPEPDMARPGRSGMAWSLLLGLGLPALMVLLSVLSAATLTSRFMGISLATWCLFACAPLTSLCLALCWRTTTQEQDPHERGPDGA